jgi:hypothetical protein
LQTGADLPTRRDVYRPACACSTRSAPTGFSDAEMEQIVLGNLAAACSSILA